jgi:hypothetical protein
MIKADQISDVRVSDIVRQVYVTAEATNFGRYEQPLGQGEWPAHLRHPSQPGEGVYGTPNLTARVVVGLDPRYPPEDGVPRDAPQDAIAANVKSFQDAFRLLFPHEAVYAYMQDTLAKPVLPPLTFDLGDCATVAQHMVKLLPRAHEAAKLAQTDPACPYNGRRSFEDAFQPAIDAPIDDVARRVKDRKTLSNDELHQAYDYTHRHPELWAGFSLWRLTMRHYLDEMLVLSQATDSARADGEQQKPGTVTEFLTSARNTIGGVSAFQIVFMPHIVGLAQRRGQLHEDRPLNPDVIKSGILLARTNGIFRRELKSQFGDRMAVCPFGNFLVSWLTQDMEARGNPAQTSLVRCYDKILQEKDRNPAIADLCANIRQGCGTIIAEYLPALDNAAPESAPSRPNGAAKCPFPRTPHNT